MPTRADFYVGRGADAEWLGSIAFDGYPDGEPKILTASTPEEFRQKVSDFLADRRDTTRPEMGWPWPWNNSCTTDYAYAFDGGKTWYSPFGHGWIELGMEQPEDSMEAPKVEFPDMTARKKTTMGPRSGLIVAVGNKVITNLE